MKLDRDGLDYLIAVAKDIGFASLSVDTHESTNAAPVITIEFRQTREPIPVVAAESTVSTSVPPWLPKQRAEDLNTLDE